MELKYHRILLKLSGEALAGEKESGLDFDVITNIGKSIKRQRTWGFRLPLWLAAATSGGAVPAAPWTAPGPTTSGCWAPA